MTKRIVLCADDYGQAEAISKGIVALLEMHRLSATSCLVNAPGWDEQAQWLKPLQATIDIGLHLNLTEGMALSQAFIERYGDHLFPLTTLMLKTTLRQLDVATVQAECNAQLDRFVEVMGCLPQFIDGHQHVHQFPVIRLALLQVYQQRLAAQKIPVRLVNERMNISSLLVDPKKDLIKKIIITAMGTKAFARLLDNNHIPHNHSFAGIYTFSAASDYALFFPQFLQKIDEGGLIMCHPGLADTQDNDTIAKARYAEYQYFSNQQFLVDCASQAVVLTRFNGEPI